MLHGVTVFVATRRFVAPSIPSLGGLEPFILTLLTALISTSGLIYSIVKDNKPIGIEKHINFHIDNLKEYQPIDSILRHNNDKIIKTNPIKDSVVQKEIINK